MSDYIEVIEKKKYHEIVAHVYIMEAMDLIVEMLIIMEKLCF